jgi:hypothetical protein
MSQNSKEPTTATSHYDEITIFQQIQLLLKEFTFGTAKIVPVYSTITLIIFATILLVCDFKLSDSFLFSLIFYFLSLYVLLACIRSIYYIIVIPLSLQQKIYLNTTLREISFSQNSLLGRYHDNANVALITYCWELRDSKNSDQVKLGAIFYFYHIVMKLSRSRADKFITLFIVTGIFFMFFFLLILTFEFYFMDVFSDVLGVQTTTTSNIVLFFGNLPVIIFSLLVISIILKKRVIYVKFLDTRVYSLEFIFLGDALSELLNKNYLIDYKIDHEDMSDYRLKKEDNKEYEMNLLIQLVIAIFLTLSISLTYNRAYTDSTKIDIAQTLELTNKAK